MDYGRKCRDINQLVLTRAQKNIGSVIGEFLSIKQSEINEPVRPAKLQEFETTESALLRLTKNLNLVCCYYENSLRDLMNHQQQHQNGLLNRNWVLIDNEASIIKTNEIVTLRRKIKRACNREIHLLHMHLSPINLSSESTAAIILPPHYFAVAFKDGLSHGLIAPQIVRYAFKELQTPFAVSLRLEYMAVIDSFKCN
jgi:hypothetical protein